MQKVSIKDIAKAVGVSNGAVSAALNGREKDGYISEALAKTIRKKAHEMNYKPNNLARGLRMGKTNIIGLILPSISDLFYSQIARIIEIEAEKLGYSLMICSSESDKEKEERVIRTLKSKQVDGIIIAPTKKSKAEIEILIKEEYPVVTFDRFFPDLPLNSIIIDNEESSYKLVRHLINQGRKNIAILTTNPHLTTMDMRFRGYKKAMEEAGMPMHPDLYGLVEYINYEENLCNVLDTILKKAPDVDGFFFTTHILALETLCYFSDHNISVNQFGMACIHEVPTFKVMAPTMHIARMPVEDIGANCVKILHENIENNRHQEKKHWINNMVMPCVLKLK